MGYPVNYRCDTGGLPMYLLRAFHESLNIEVFVELGTAGGDSIKEAAKIIKECHTIEINADRPDYFSGGENIKWHIGNSVDILPGIISSLQGYKLKHNISGFRYALFFIDSHFDGDKPPDSPYKDCYLLEELNIISKYSQDSIIIIDDARLFMGNPPQPNDAGQWPKIKEIFQFIEHKFPFFNVYICDDYILAFPDRVDWVYQKEWMANYQIRYPSPGENLRMKTKEVFNHFKKYVD